MYQSIILGHMGKVMIITLQAGLDIGQKMVWDRRDKEKRKLVSALHRSMNVNIYFLGYHVVPKSV